MPGPGMTLAEALRRNGVDSTEPAYENVAIKAAPSWLRAVWPKGIRAMALPKRIYVTIEMLQRIAAGDARNLLRHEAVHVDQWRRHGRVGFLAKYLADYVKGRAAGKSHKEAYRSIPFEEEARSRSE
jgi:hypothetical protein